MQSEKMQVFTITGLENKPKVTEPVQIIIPDDPPTLAQQKVNKLRGGDGSCVPCCIFIIAILILLGFLIGAIVSFTTGNINGGTVCVVILVLCCCGESGGGYYYQN